jgi:hypothetical protein
MVTSPFLVLHHTECKSVGAGVYSYPKGGGNEHCL